MPVADLRYFFSAEDIESKPLKQQGSQSSDF